MREACPLWENHGGSSAAADRGTKQHEFTENPVDDGSLSDDELIAAAECIDYATVLKDGFEAEGYRVEEVIEAYLPIDDRKWSIPSFNPLTGKTRRRRAEATTAGFVDRILLVPDKEHIEVMDWKFGKWAVEAAIDNLQGIAYVLGAFKQWPWAKTIRLSFKQPHLATLGLDDVTAHTFSRADIPELTLRVVTVVERAADAAANVGEYERATPCVPACLFCGRRGRCKKVTDIALRVGKKYYPAAIPENITAEDILDPRDRATGMRLAQIVSAWATGFKSESTRQVIMGESPLPPGYEIKQYSKRKIEDPAKFRRAALAFLSDEEYINCLTPTLGSTETAIRDKTPRGKKKDAVKEFQAHLETQKAIGRTTPSPYLAVVTKAPGSGDSK